MFLSYILPFFNVTVEMFGQKKSETINGFASIAGENAVESTFTMVLPLLFIAFMIVCQFVKPLEKFKSLSNLIGGAGSSVFLIISAIIVASYGNELATISPFIGFFVALIISLALAAYGLILFVKKK